MVPLTRRTDEHSNLEQGEWKKKEDRGKKSLLQEEKYTTKCTDKEFESRGEIRIRCIQNIKEFCLQEIERETSRNI